MRVGVSEFNPTMTTCQIQYQHKGLCGQMAFGVLFAATQICTVLGILFARVPKTASLNQFSERSGSSFAGPGVWPCHLGSIYRTVFVVSRSELHMVCIYIQINKNVPFLHFEKSIKWHTDAHTYKGLHTDIKRDLKQQMASVPFAKSRKSLGLPPAPYIQDWWKQYACVLTALANQTQTCVNNKTHPSASVLGFQPPPAPGPRASLRWLRITPLADHHAPDQVPLSQDPSLCSQTGNVVSPAVTLT